MLKFAPYFLYCLGLQFVCKGKKDFSNKQTIFNLFCDAFGTALRLQRYKMFFNILTKIKLFYIATLLHD